MLKKRNIIWLLLICFIFLSSCSNSKQTQSKFINVKNKLPNFQTVSLEKRTIILYANGDGYIQSDQVVNIRSQVDGTVKSTPCLDGSFVNKGAVILEIDNSKLARELSDARTALILGQLDYSMEQRKAKESDALYKLKSVSKDEFLTSKISLKKQFYSYLKLKADLDEKEKKIAQSIIYAPFTGKIVKLATSLGSSISAGNDLLSIANMDTLSAIITIPQDYVQYLKSGIPITLSGSAIPEGQLTAQFVKINENTDNSNNQNQNQGQILIKCSFKSKKPEKVYLGTYVNAQVLLGKKDNVWSLPLDTIWLDPSGYYVCILAKEKNKAFIKKCPVQIGINDGNYVEILNPNLELLRQVILIKDYNEFMALYPYMKN